MNNKNSTINNNHKIKAIFLYLINIIGDNNLFLSLIQFLTNKNNYIFLSFFNEGKGKISINIEKKLLLYNIHYYFIVFNKYSNIYH